MGYVAVSGGRAAIEASMLLMERLRLEGGLAPRVDQVRAGLGCLVDQVMSEGSLYAEDVAGLAIKQAMGSPEEAVFLTRAHRSTLARKYSSQVVRGADMRLERRISACFKDIPGGQMLGPSPDYSHRLLDGALWGEGDAEAAARLMELNAEAAKTDGEAPPDQGLGARAASKMRKVADYLREEGLLAQAPQDDSEPGDVTKRALEFPARRCERLQVLSRGQTGAVTALGYASLRAYGLLHPTVSELRVGMASLIVPAESGGDGEDDYYVGEIRLTEVETLVPIELPGGGGKSELRFDLGYGLCFGRNETKAIAMSLLDQCLEIGGPYPTNNQEFVLYHVDPVEASGFISHLKLPHYVTFQAKLDALRRARAGKK